MVTENRNRDDYRKIPVMVIMSLYRLDFTVQCFFAASLFDVSVGTL